MHTPNRTIELRRERTGEDLRRLWAYVDDDGAVHIDGQDLGPATAPVSSDGEYEWFTTIAADDIPRLVEALGGSAGDDALEVVGRYTGSASYELERLLKEGGVPIEFFSC